MSKKFIITLISFLFLMVILVLVFIQSIESNNPSNKGFVVYLLEKNSTEKSVLFTENDIREYDWEKQEIIFKEKFLNSNSDKKDKENRDEKYDSGGSKILFAEYQDRFLLSLNGEKIYIGTFKQSYFSSYRPDIPYIEDIENGVKINWNEIEGREDIRFNKELYEYLKEKKIIS